MTSLPHQYWPESGSSRVLSSRLVSAVFSASLWWKNLSKPWLTRVLTWAPVRYRRKSNYKLLGISKENLEIIDILVFPGKCLIQSYFALQTLKTLFDFSTLYHHTKIHYDIFTKQMDSNIKCLLPFFKHVASGPPSQNQLISLSLFIRLKQKYNSLQNIFYTSYNDD